MTVASRALALRLMKTAAAAGDMVRPPPAGVVVLLYHRVGAGSGLEVDLPEPLFAEQIALLAAETRPVRMDDALVALEGPPPDDGRPRVVVTFDDGTADFLDVALPVLVRHQVPATIYLATEFVDSGRPFPDRGTPLSWSALRDALATGLVDVGSHTHTHALLDRLDPREVDGELDRSTGLIRDRLAVKAHHFAYPKAVAGSTAAAEAVRQRFRSAALAGTRANRYGHTDPFRLARSPVQVSDGMRWFRHKLAGGMALEDRLRGVLNRRRYAGATT